MEHRDLGAKLRSFYLLQYEVYYWTTSSVCLERSNSMVVLTSQEHWMKWSEDYDTLPFLMRIPLSEYQVKSWLPMWNNTSKTSFILESGKSGRYSYLGNQPCAMIQGKGNHAQILEIDTQSNKIKHSRSCEGSPLKLVKEWMSPYRSPYVAGAPHFLGGCVGFWGYDVIRLLENIPQLAQDDLSTPDYCFARYDEMWILDHVEQAVYTSVHMHLQSESKKNRLAISHLYEQALVRATEMVKEWNRLVIHHESSHHVPPMMQEQLAIDIDTIQELDTAFSKASYMQAVLKIQDYISQGDVFQVNLSIRQSKKLVTSPEHIYEALRYVNPSPYMGMLRFEQFTIVSGSPELLVQCIQGQLTTRPIAGTRPRGINDAEDKKLVAELVNNEKERAEHVMLVDLERNDFGRIAKYGTVKVKEFMAVEPYSHVMHIVSEINGELAEGKDAYDVIQATFPGGTITGAPKIRTMQIIEELEPVRRGTYTGSMGWIDYHGDMEFNIIIRSMLYTGGTGYVQAGAGIVTDSIPEKEYLESLNKTKAMWKAIEYSQVFAKQV
jgi:para-aminobenzoate synthetase component 1